MKVQREWFKRNECWEVNKPTQRFGSSQEPTNQPFEGIVNPDTVEQVPKATKEPEPQYSSSQLEDFGNYSGKISESNPLPRKRATMVEKEKQKVGEGFKTLVSRSKSKPHTPVVEHTYPWDFIFSMLLGLKLLIKAIILLISKINVFYLNKLKPSMFSSLHNTSFFFFWWV